MTEILKYCIPALIVLLATWIVMYKLFQNEQQKREWELKKAAQKEISPIRLRAYERLALVLERTQPEHLLMDLDVSQFTVPQLQQRLLQTIRLEFDHNMSQQIYVSEQVWDKIVAARGQMLAFVREHVAGLCQDPADSLQYQRRDSQRDRLACPEGRGGKTHIMDD